jgi:hypothetical protein
MEIEITRIYFPYIIHIEVEVYLLAELPSLELRLQHEGRCMDRSVCLLPPLLKYVQNLPLYIVGHLEPLDVLLNSKAGRIHLP